jgi:hypothetical protein
MMQVTLEPLTESAMPKLFVEYLGMGDSDKPRDYPYSTTERTDLVEAIWRYLGVVSTTVYSALSRNDGRFFLLAQQRLGAKGLAIAHGVQ